MPFLKKFFQSIGHFFENLFNAAEHAWNKLEPEAKEALQQASAFVSVINNNVSEAPDFVKEILLQRFNIGEDKIHTSLTKAATELNLVAGIADPDLLTVIQRLQEYLKNKKGSFWAQASNSLANLLAVIFAPTGTKFARISLLMEFVYQTFFRKDKKEDPAPMPVADTNPGEKTG